MLSEEERKRIENRKRKHRRLARQLLNIAVELRKARRRLATAANMSRPDLSQCGAYGEVRTNGLLWVNTLLELAARLALPPWVPPAAGTRIQWDGAN